jgi:hypothetical protein
MAITTTEILGTDSIAGSRIVINDNFAILRDEINAIESYIDPDAGTIDGLNSLSTLELRVGPAGGYYLELTGTGFDINSPLSLNANLDITGLISHDSFGLLDEAAFTGLAVVDPTIGFANYSILHSSTSDFVIELGAGNPGQDVSFFIEQHGGGSVIIQADTLTVFVLDTANDKVSLDDIGSSLTMRYVLDSTNNGAWYIVNVHNATLTT